MFKDAHDFIQRCDRYQREGNITKRNEKPQNPILEVEVFDVWGFDFMGPFNLPPMEMPISLLMWITFPSGWKQ